MEYYIFVFLLYNEDCICAINIEYIDLKMKKTKENQENQNNRNHHEKQ